MRLFQSPGLPTCDATAASQGKATCIYLFPKRLAQYYYTSYR